MGLFPTAENRNLWEETEKEVSVLVLVLKGGSGFRAAKRTDRTPTSLQPECRQNWV